jgi:DNA-directed RNA polymerase subunit RPC12/RpoP
MAIKVRCGSCGAGFQVKDELAGRRVKCPQCKQPIVIKASGGLTTGGSRQLSAAAKSHNPLLDLLDEQDIRSVVRGRICEQCGCEVAPNAVVCVECGYNLETGEVLKTESYDDDFDATNSDSTMSDAERIMAKAEKDIEDMPVTSEDQNFGDGSESYLIAAVGMIVAVILISAAMVVILMMESITEVWASSAVSFAASTVLYFSMGVWISIVAFRSRAGHGVACIATAFLWCIVFGFLQGKGLLIPVLVLIVCLLIGGASGTYSAFYGWTPSAPV